MRELRNSVKLRVELDINMTIKNTGGGGEEEQKFVLQQSQQQKLFGNNNIQLIYSESTVQRIQDPYNKFCSLTPLMWKILCKFAINPEMSLSIGELFNLTYGEHGETSIRYVVRHLWMKGLIVLCATNVGQTRRQKRYLITNEGVLFYDRVQTT